MVNGAIISNLLFFLFEKFKDQFKKLLDIEQIPELSLKVFLAIKKRGNKINLKKGRIIFGAFSRKKKGHLSLTSNKSGVFFF